MTGKKALWLLLTLSLLMVPSGAAWGQTEAPALTAIKVQFKVEEITKENFYMGEVWVWPAKFTGVRVGKKFTVQAKAWGLEAGGRPHKIEPAWSSSDRSFLVVEPNQGQRVKLTVLRPGEGEVLLTYGDLSKKLRVKAQQRGNLIQAEIFQ